jgi:CheY-like chemotaxis protein
MRQNPNYIHSLTELAQPLRTSQPVTTSRNASKPPAARTAVSALTAARPILHTDDEISNLILVKMMLERLGYTVMSAVSAWDALSICQTQPISLVISDISKPKMTGFDLLEQLRASPATQALTFAFLTTRCDTITRNRGIALGADDYLCQPVPLRELSEKVGPLLLKSLALVPGLALPEFTGEGMGAIHPATFGGYSVEVFTGPQWEDVVISHRKLCSGTSGV